MECEEKKKKKRQNEPTLPQTQNGDSVNQGTWNTYTPNMLLQNEL